MGPGAAQEFFHRRRRLEAAGALLELLGGQVAGLLEALLAPLGFRGAALGQLDAAAVLVEEGAQLLLKRLEDGDVFVELGDQAVDGALGLLQQLALLRELSRRRAGWVL